MAWTPFLVEASPASPRIVRGLRLLALLAATLVVVTGAAVLLGWALHVRWVTTSSLSMAPNEGLLLLLGGLSLGLSLGNSSRLRWAAKVLALVGGSLALVTLAQDVVGRDLGVDIFLFRTGAARPAVATSVAALLADAALLLLDFRAPRLLAPSEVLAMASVVVGWISVGIHLYGSYAPHAVPPHAATPPGPGPGFHGAVGLVVLALGIVASRPDTGAMATFTSAHVGGQAARRVLPIALSLPVLGYFAVWAQRAGLYDAPGAAVVEGVAGMVAAVAITVAVGRSLDRTDAERRRTEQEMREWKRFFDRATFGAVLGTEDGRLGRINEAFARMHGYEVAELEGRPIAEVFPRERQPELAAKMQMVQERGHCRWESEHVRKDGTLFPVFVDVTSVCDDEGRPLYRAAYIQDITEQKEAEAARARLASLVESSDDVIVAETLEGTVLDWNHAAERVFGYSAREMVGRSICIIVPDDLRDERCGMRARALAGETVVGVETERVRKDGRRIQIALTLSPIRDPVGRVVGISTIERDISTLKRLQREREEWSAVVAHDLRQPAAAIRLSADTLAASEASPARLRVIERIRKAADRLDRMIGDLLDVSRIESQRLAVHADAVDLRPLVSDVLAQQPDLQNRCRVEVDADAERAWVDAERFVQVLSNLLSNASKYGDADSPVDVSVEPVDGMVRVTVTNEGPGIPPEEIPKLFSRFARSHAAKTSAVPGLGLGLYICRGIIEAHGGRLWAESVPGDKTHFRFTLPRAPEGVPAEPSVRRARTRVSH